MVRHLLLGIGITLIVFSLVLIKVDIGSTELTEEEIVAKAKKLGMSFPGEHYTQGISLEKGVNLEETLGKIVKKKTEEKSLVFKEETKKVIKEQENKRKENSSEKKEEVIAVVVPSGINAREVAELLMEKGLLEEKDVFIELLEKFNIENKVMAGAYEFKKEISHLELLLKLTAN